MNFNDIPRNYNGEHYSGEITAGHQDGMLENPYMTDQFGHGPPLGAMGHMEHPIYDQGERTGLEGEYHELQSIMVDGGDHFGVSALAFDSQELVWMGNQGGHVTSYYGLHLEKYSSFQAHPHGDDIRQLISHEKGVLSLSKNQLRLTERRGIKVFEYLGEEMQEMQCMLQTSPSSIIMGGHQTKVIELDLNKVQEIRKADVEEPGCAIFRRSQKFLCAGDTSGKVTLFDPVTMKSEHVLEAHSGTLSDFDLHGNLLVTAGFSNRLGNLNVDRFLVVYDLRTMRAMAPTQVIIDPMFLRFVPTYSNRLAVVSQTGQFQLIEATAMTAASMMLYQIHTHGGLIMTFDISSSCQTMAFGDSTGYMHLFGTTDQATFNSYPEPTEFVHPPDHLQPIHINDELTPLSIIPMQYPTQGTLLSDWPEYLCQKVYRKAKPVDPEILRSMKVYHNVGYAPNPGNKRRNQVQYKLNENNKHRSRKSSVPESPMGRGDDPFVVVPKRYRRVEIKYSRLGVEDFDFRHYNKTNFAGLETHIPNAYCNSMLQVLYFIEPLRISLLSHLCTKEFCLACELGYLFHMLDKQKGQTCQASNFLRAFRTIPEASALGLVLGDAEETMGKFNLSRLIQSWQRFLHQQIHSETSSHTPPEPEPVDSPNTEAEEKEEGSEEGMSGETTEEDKNSTENKKDETPIIGQLFNIPMITMLKCRCGHEVQRESNSTLINLSYPDCSPQGPGMSPQQFSFSQVLHHSMVSEQSTQAWCNICEKYQPHVQSKVLKSLPDVLALNCEIENQRDMDFWRTQQKFIRNTEEEKSEPGPRESTPMSKMCRYGAHCARQDCRFRHPAGEGDGDGGESFLDLSRLSDEDCFEPSWVPLGLKIARTDEGQISLEEIADDISEESLQSCQINSTSWLCPKEDCAKVLSRKQTLRSHLATTHAIYGETPSKRYKLYEVNGSLPVPLSTQYRKKKRSSDCNQETFQTVNEHSEAADVSSNESLPTNTTNGALVNCLFTDSSGEDHVSEMASEHCTGSETLLNSPSEGSDMEISDVDSVTSDSSDLEEDNAVASVSHKDSDPPLYVLGPNSKTWSSSITKSAHHLSVSAFACRHNLSDTALKHLLDLIQIHLPRQNIAETNANKIKELCGFDNSCIQYHFYCNFCKKLFSDETDDCKTPGCIGNKLNSESKKYFLTSSIRLQMKDVLEKDGIWQAIKTSKSSNGSALSDIKTGLAYKKLEETGNFLHNSNNITFSMFTDGVPLFKSSGVSIWPVYLLINELPPRQRFTRRNMLLWGVWQGVGKPNMNMFLKPLVMDLLDLYENGATISTFEGSLTVKALLLLVTMDLQARANVVNMTQHNGINGCLYCMEPGMTVPSGKGHCRIYPVREKPAERRTHTQVKNSAQKARKDGKRIDGFIGESVLSYLPYFSLPDNVVIDYMHGILIGITKQFLELWFDPKQAKEDYNICDEITDIDKRLKNIHPPYMIHRHPRVLSKTYHHWKASEMRNWLLFYSIPCLLGHLSNVYLLHFSCLVEATYILLGEGMTSDDLNRADMLLQKFVANITRLYPQRMMGINMHNLTHLVHCVRYYGPLWVFSCFAFESFNGELKRSIHGTGNVCKQMFWVHQAQKKVEQKARNFGNSEEQRFLRTLFLEPDRSSLKSEAYQCSVGKLKPVASTLSLQIQSVLLNLAGTCNLSDFLMTSKIHRNGFYMYSTSSKKVKKQNSYTILLEESPSEALAIEVHLFLCKIDSRKVFAVGILWKSTEYVLPGHVPHLRRYRSTGNGETVIKAEKLREPLVVVKSGHELHAGCLPNHFERD